MKTLLTRRCIFKVNNLTESKGEGIMKILTLVIVLGFLALVFFNGCVDDEEATVTDTDTGTETAGGTTTTEDEVIEQLDVANFVLTLPSCIATAVPSYYFKNQGEESSDSATGIYGGLPSILSLVNMVGSEILPRLYDSFLSDVTETGVFDVGDGQFTATVTTGTDYDWNIIVIQNTTSETFIDAKYTVTGDDAKGDIKMNISLADDADVSGKMRVVFDSTGEENIMQLYVTEMVDPNDVNAPTSIYCDISESNGVLSVAANLYFYNGLSGGDGSGPDISSNETYNMRILADSASNVAIVDLAIADEAVTETDIFETYSLANVLKTTILDYLREAFPDVFGGLTDAEILAFIESSDNFAAFEYVLTLTNPAYFAEDGYQGTTEPATGFENLDAADLEDIVILSPYDIANMSIVIE